MGLRDSATLLGGLTPAAFVARHWHKSPLLVRDAMAQSEEVVSRDELVDLAARDDVASRLIRRSADGYTLEHGPFRRGRLARLPRRDVTLLVQGVNLHSRAADALLRRFAFIPHARLDDLMVSYAAPGGGVGPHVDSYDVFLLQATGRRRWRYGRQDDLSLREGLPLKILQTFDPSDDATLRPGDMLYLPPHIAHDGIAVDECMTCSIGFRAPLYQEVVEACLDDLRDTLVVEGRYADPDLRATKRPGRIDASMQRRLVAAIDRVRIDGAATKRFVGRFLTEPKPDVVFTPPPRPSRGRFARAGARGGIRLDPRTLLLYDATHFYLNGVDATLADAHRSAVQQLADSRMLSARTFVALPPATIDVLYDWYRHGYLGHP